MEYTEYYANLPEQVAAYLTEGDRITLQGSMENDCTGQVYLATFLGYEGGNAKIVLRASDGSALDGESYCATVVRSGFTNQLTVDAGNISALKDPTQ